MPFIKEPPTNEELQAILDDEDQRYGIRAMIAKKLGKPRPDKPAKKVKPRTKQELHTVQLDKQRKELGKLKLFDRPTPINNEPPPKKNTHPKNPHA